MTDKMLGEVESGIGWLTINNPERHNAVSLEMAAKGAEIIAQFSADQAVRVIVIRASGDKAWMSGADIGDFNPKAGAAPRTGSGFNFYEAVYDCAKPVVAALKGYTMGGGVALACACDLRIAATDSVIAIPAGRLGIAYPPNFLRWVIDTIGLPNTKEMLFTGRRYSADDALRMGFANRLVEPDALASATLEYAQSIADSAPLSVRANKETMREVVKDALHWNEVRIAELGALCKNSADFAEGRLSFAEKRKPVFRGE
jgi:enoyl-CoA hydratase/carnithine racemase